MKLGLLDRYPVLFRIRCAWRGLFLTSADWLKLENAALGSAERLRHEVRFNDWYSSRDKIHAAKCAEQYDALIHNLFGPYPHG